MKKVLIALLVGVMFISLLPMQSVLGAGKTYNVGGGWSYRVDTPDNAKPYHHIHFMKKGKKVYCLRLDTMGPCDKKNNSYKNFDSLPKKVKQHVSNNKYVQGLIKKENPQTKSWISKIPKWALVSVGALAVFLATATFFFPGDDVAAWAFFLRAMAV
ncbi:hypothetical protein [Bacillus safensis]|uniref:hypothetical protein n=1 Tax=Bacillus safensis TaxID=561879 RepID=UPI000597841E|nr:hypothetical protein [Bacillus safensis]APJ13077.1 hypothetical protein BSL056_19900 [Bacillus safensis]